MVKSHTSLGNSCIIHTFREKRQIDESDIWRGFDGIIGKGIAD